LLSKNGQISRRVSTQLRDRIGSGRGSSSTSWHKVRPALPVSQAVERYTETDSKW
jgi:hypothetical protein